MNYRQRLLSLIPGGAHTYSRGYDQFPANCPQILTKGNKCYIYDINNRKILDYGMGLRSVILGYNNNEVNRKVIEAIKKGNNLTLPSLLELKAAETITNLITTAEMVKFAKNGSNVTTAAVKLARAYTGRDYVARCIDHPFFSFDDWFIGSTVMNKGVPKQISDLTITFKYGDLKDLENLFEKYPNKISCVIMEAATTNHPPQGYLQKVKEICHKNGALFILDEIITGFRWHLKGAQYYYNIDPDLSTFGKAMSNGFSIAALVGKKEFMKLGSIELEGQERVFLLSSTYGAEMTGLAAFLATLNILQRENVIEYIWKYGEKLIQIFNKKAKEIGIQEYFKADGIPCSPWYITYNSKKQICLGMKTLFLQEMIKNRVFIPWISISYSHTQKELEITEKAIEKALKVYSLALEDGYQKYLEGHIIKPVFRKYN